MSLPEPSFIERNPQKITADLIALFEQMTGKVLQPAQPERLFIDLVAYRETLLRIAIQEAAKQNLVEYARFPMLDYLGDLPGVTRLPAQPARTTIRFTIVADQTFDVAVPVNTRVDSKDGRVIFNTTLNAVIPAGELTVDVVAVADPDFVGAVGNGYLAGDISNLVDTVAYIQSASNISISYGGADEETDDRLRERLKESPEKFSVAGPGGAYKYWAKTAHQNIVDVAVTTPAGGEVNVYPLTIDGNPTSEIIDLVEAILSPDDIRPLNDLVHVLSPTQADFSITAAMILYDWADPDLTLAQVNAALNSYAAEHRSKLGRDIVVDQINGIISGVYGVYKPGLTAPATDTVLDDTQWANCTGITVSISGYANG